MTESDIPHALSILGDELGRRYISRDELSSFLPNAHPGRFAYVAEVDRAVAGAVTAEVLDPDDFFSNLPANMREDVRRSIPFLEYQRIGHLKSIAVAKHQQGCGLATRLVDATMKQLWNRGATCVVTIGWTTSDGCHIAGVVEAVGFERIAVMDEFWLVDSQEKDYQCPRCGAPCHCQAQIFIRRRIQKASELTEYVPIQVAQPSSPSE